MQGVLSRASFRRPPLSGQETFTVSSLHISNIHAKKKGIAKKLILTVRAIMISQQIDVVAGEINGTARRCPSRNNISTIDEAFVDCALPTPPGPKPLWGPRSIPKQVGRRLWIPLATGLRSLLESAHARCFFPSHAKLSAWVQPIKVAIMRHGSTWISSTGATLVHSMVSMIDEFSSKNVLCPLIKGRRRGGSVIL